MCLCLMSCTDPRGNARFWLYSLSSDISLNVCNAVGSFRKGYLALLGRLGFESTCS